MTLEQALDEVHGRGWYLYHLGAEGPHWPHPPQWSCTLRLEAGPASRIARGSGATSLDALALAIDSMENAEIEIPRPATFSIEPAVSISSILTNLRAKQAPIKRRI